ncbi:hypothetical protein FS749_001247 [Ceratobasidium sp. UAMH 11750]|nr:hypothetical protein FS749_001247 [Ceratobasidium sp. UAMH 11750]
MASKSKKRKAEDSVESAQNSSLSKEDLRDRLSKCPPKNIAQALLESVNTATLSELRALQSLLGPLLENANVPLHCVRCHQQYTEPTNDRYACNIEHMEPSRRGYRKRKVTYPCCDREVRMEIRCYYADDVGEYCFSGPHTTDPNEVDYHSPDLQMGNDNVLTCEDMGCD